MFDLIQPYFENLYRLSGINFIVFYDRYEYGRLIGGMAVTIALGASCILLSLVIGILGAWAQEAPSRVVRHAVAAYIQAFRNTPPLVQMLFFYFGLGQITPQVDAGGYFVPLIGAFGWAVISLGCFGGAFNVEIFRASISAVPHGLREAADSLGYTRTQTFAYVIFPLAFRFSLPALTGNLISLLKTTSLAYAIAVPEMTQIANQIWSDNVNVPEMMLILFVFYNLIVAALAGVLHTLERSLRISGYR